MNKVITLLNDNKTIIEQDDAKYFYNNIPVPRVTEILSSISEDYLLIWANSLGFKRERYKDVLNRAADIGTAAHNTIEKFLKGEIYDKNNIPFKGFKLWWDIINTNNKVTIIGQEESLICEWFGGTYDLLLDINDKVYLVDFKTSNHIGYKYFLQLASYRYMLLKCKNINIHGCVLLQLNKFEDGFDEYVLDFTNIEHYQFIEHCAMTFFSLVFTYYNVYKAKEMYNNIF
jgi:hypothetical protein